MECAEDSDVLRQSNIVSSHVIYKVKVDEQDNKNFKASIFPHGGRDAKKDNIKIIQQTHSSI